MKALSLLQPWASLVEIGAKRWETRSWSTTYRGPLAIHASKKFDRAATELCATEPFVSVLKDAWLLHFFSNDHDFGAHSMPLGCVIATCELVDVRRTEDVLPLISEQEAAFGDYGAGRFAWKLENVVILTDPIPAKGMLGLWNFECPASAATCAAERGEAGWT